MATSTRDQMDRTVNDHFRYEATDDIEGVLSTFSDDAEHEVIGGPDGPLRGRPALRRFYEGLFPDLKGESVEPLMRMYGDDFVIDVTLWHGQVVDGRPFGLPGRRGPLSFRLLHVFQLRDGLITKENMWFDYDAVQSQLTASVPDRDVAKV
jgi:ketosteroid isomerase-like protein